MPGVTVLIEAKVYADEQPGQCDRLADAWTEEEPELVFLTLDGRLSYTAVRSAGLWHRLAWPQVAAVIADAARASGVLEEAFSRAVGIVSQHPDALEIVKGGQRNGPCCLRGASCRRNWPDQ